MATIYYTLSRKIDKVTGQSQVLVRFVVGSRINQRGKAPIFVQPQFWNAKKQLATIPQYRLMNDEQKRLIEYLNGVNETLSKLKNIISSAYNSESSDKQTLPPDWLTSVITSCFFPAQEEKPAPVTLSQAFDYYLETHALSEIRQRNIQVVSRSLARYKKFKGATLELDSITAEVMKDFENYQREEASIVAKRPDLLKVCPESRSIDERGENTIIGRMRIVRAVLNWAYKEDLTKNIEFTKYKMQSCIYGTPYYISIDERNKIYRMNLSRHPELAIQRDIFVFQCLIGCRVSDLINLTKDNLIGGAIEYIPTKTKDEVGEIVPTVRVPLNSIAKEIVERYKSDERASLLPFISPQRYNDSIKRIFLAARLTRTVTVLDPLTRKETKKPLNEIASSHIARRTFIGNLYKKVKDPNLIGSMSGHSEGSRAFSRYRNIDEEIKKELVKELE
ncbi:MAG: phage integrase SAM-like domain-containing protein [Bacteroidales bacterium]|nr:phage integrase SAM-like domain-containing protein [Bacteroidales bacterium]